MGGCLFPFLLTFSGREGGLPVNFLQAAIFFSFFPFGTDFLLSSVDFDFSVFFFCVKDADVASFLSLLFFFVQKREFSSFCEARLRSSRIFALVTTVLLYCV